MRGGRSGGRALLRVVRRADRRCRHAAAARTPPHRWCRPLDDLGDAPDQRARRGVRATPCRTRCPTRAAVRAATAGERSAPTSTASRAAPRRRASATTSGRPGVVGRGRVRQGREEEPQRGRDGAARRRAAGVARGPDRARRRVQPDRLRRRLARRCAGRPGGAADAASGRDGHAAEPGRRGDQGASPTPRRGRQTRSSRSPIPTSPTRRRRRSPSPCSRAPGSATPNRRLPLPTGSPTRASRRQLTVDDSVAQSQISAGVAKEVAETGEYAHAITKWLGRDSQDFVPAVGFLDVDRPGLAARLLRRPVELRLRRRARSAPRSQPRPRDRPRRSRSSWWRSPTPPAATTTSPPRWPGSDHPELPGRRRRTAATAAGAECRYRRPAPPARPHRRPTPAGEGAPTDG